MILNLYKINFYNKYIMNDYYEILDKYDRQKILMFLLKLITSFYKRL